MLFFVVLCPGSPEGSTGSGSGFKVSQKTGQVSEDGQRLKVSSDRLGEAGNQTCDPWFDSPNLIIWVVGIYSFAKLKKMNFTCH